MGGVKGGAKGGVGLGFTKQARRRKKSLQRPSCAAFDAVFPPHRAVRNVIANRLPKVGTWVRLFPQGGGFFSRAFVVSVHTCDDMGNKVVTFALPCGTQLRQFHQTFRWAHHPATRLKCPMPTLRPLDAAEPCAVDFRRCAVAHCDQVVRNPFLCDLHWAQYGIRAAPEEGKGMGLQFARDFPEANTPVCPYTGQITTADEGKEHSVRRMQVGDRFEIEGSVPLPKSWPQTAAADPNPRALHHMGSLANEPNSDQTPNAEFVRVPIRKMNRAGAPTYLMSAVYLHTTRPVKANEFVNVRYTTSDQPPWDHHVPV